MAGAIVLDDGCVCDECQMEVKCDLFRYVVNLQEYLRNEVQSFPPGVQVRLEIAECPGTEKQEPIA